MYSQAYFRPQAANPAPAAATSGGGFSPLASLFVSITGGNAAAAEAEEEEDAAPSAASRGGGGWLGGWGRSSGSGGRSSGGDAAAAAPAAASKQPAKSGERQAKAGAAAAAAAAAAKAAPAASAPPPRQSLLQRLASQLYDLEARVNAETTATERQTTLVQQLREEVAAGRAKEEELQREEGALAVMQYALQVHTQILGAGPPKVGAAFSGHTGSRHTGSRRGFTGLVRSQLGRGLLRQRLCCWVLQLVWRLPALAMVGGAPSTCHACKEAAGPQRSRQWDPLLLSTASTWPPGTACLPGAVWGQCRSRPAARSCNSRIP